MSPTSGPKQGGQLVTLDGTNFVSGAKVYFGGIQSASMTFVSAAQLKASTPKGAVGAQTITITNPSGLSVAKPNAYTYTGQKPKILTSSPTTGAISGGTELRINGEFLTTDVGVLIGGQPATQVTHLDGNSPDRGRAAAQRRRPRRRDADRSGPGAVDAARARSAISR